MINTKIYIVENNEVMELGLCTSLDFDNDFVDTESIEVAISGSGEFNIKLNASYENTSVVIKNLCRELRKKPNLESWKGEGKRRMKVIK